jgi:hypothetical protein
MCCIAVSFPWLVLPRRSREQSALRIREIASLVLHPDAWSRVPGRPGREVATGEVTGDLTDAAGRPARGS